MRKYSIIAIAMLAALLSCKRLEVSVAAPQEIEDEFDNGEPVPILFGSNISASVETKASINAFDGNQELHIYGIALDNAGNLDLNNIIIDDVTASSPAAGTGEIAVEDPDNGTYYYYLQNTRYDFFGYHIGDATLTGGKSQDADGIYLDLAIDGSQDLLVAHADAAGMTLADEAWRPRLFSAYTARAPRNVHPELKFKHVLSRFQFYTIDGSQNADVVLTLTNLWIKDTKTDARLTVVGDPQTLVPEASPVADLYLKDDSGSTDLDHVVSTGNSTPVKVGESLMLMPGETEYVLDFTISQVAAGPNPGTPEVRTVAPISVPVSGGSLAGTSYKVNITVYSLEKIVVDVSLEEWADAAEEINIGQED